MTQEDFIVLANEGKNIFLTGNAGTGKTYILNKWKSENSHKKIITVAPTGIAAINAGGVTIHSAFRLYGDNYHVFKKQEINWNNIDVLIIDEISMVSCDLFDYISDVIKKHCFSSEEFGGLQVITVGDLAQLPPIFNNKDEKSAARYKELMRTRGGVTFKFSRAYKGFTECNLTEAKRSKDPLLNSLLNRLREGDMLALHEFKSEGYSTQFSNKATHIFPYNTQVDNYNHERLSKIAGKTYKFKGFVKGEFNLNNVLAPIELSLKIGATVMCIKNLECGLVNGDMCEVLEIKPKFITVRSERLETDFDIYLETWKNIHYDEQGNEQELGRFIQFPLRLGFAMTAHKCLDGNQLIKGIDGRFKISNGQIGDKVYTANGIYPIIGKQYMGKKDTIKITTRTGLELISTKDHRILTAIDYKEEYIEAGKLSIGNKLIINRDIREGGKDIKIPISELSARSKLVNYPKYIDKDLSYYIGLLIGDGSYNYKKDGRLDVESKDIEISNFLKDFYNRLDINLLIRDKKKSKSRSHIVISKNLRDTLFNIGLDYVTGKDKVIPECFNEMDINNRGQLLSGLFDTDGSVNNKGSVRFTTTSNKLVKQIQLMLLDMGIISFIKTMKVYSDNHNQSYQLCINGNNIILFQKYIGFKIGYKNKLLNDYINSGKLKGKTNVDWIINDKEIIEEFKNHLKGKGFYKKGMGYSSDERINSIINMKHLSYTHLEYLNNFSINKGIELPILNSTLNNNYYYDEIISIEDNGETDVYDLEIDTEHSFVAQGIVVHNCQGLTLEKVIFHYNNSLSKELVYVACSRVTSYDGIYIVK